MWFPRRRKNETHNEADLAIKEAFESLAEIKEMGNEVTETADKTREIRHRNHFAEKLEEIILQRRGNL